MKVRYSPRKQARMDMLPLIDVVFLLLVFFIYAMMSMSVHSGINIQLPASESAIKSKPSAISVSIKKNGDIYLEKTKITLNSLGLTIKQKIINQEKPGVIVYGDKDISYQKIISVIDEIKSAGVTKISLQAEAE